MTSFPNIYSHRKVAVSAAKPCEVCYKPSTSVLLALDHKDFFYICPIHLKDKGFCKPIVNQPPTDVQRNHEIDEEIARLKKEFEERQIKKNLKNGEISESKPQTEENNDAKGKEIKLTQKIKDNNIPTITITDEPRNFTLLNVIYQQRVERWKRAEIAKHRNERLRNPNLFPQVPDTLSKTIP